MSAKFLDCVRVVAAALAEALGAAVRRMFGRARCPTWKASFEIVVAATRGSWSLMPVIGIVRWRNVAEALCPLRTDGLVPRAVEIRPGLAAAWLEPPDCGQAVLLYFHGGGYVFGSLRTHGDLIGALARAGRARTMALTYRLAPEHPAPAAVDDAVAAYLHLLAEGIAPERIVLAGDSAGGNLVLATLIALREQGHPRPAGGVVVSPWVDLACSGDSFRANEPYDFVGIEHCRLAAAAFLGGEHPASPKASPLFADLRGLPPLLVHAGGKETLVDQIRAFVARAREAGVHVTYAEYPDMIHVWHLHRRMIQEGQRAIDEIGAFIHCHVPS